MVLQLPAAWGARNRTLSLQGSTWDHSQGVGDLRLHPSANNTATIAFRSTTRRSLTGVNICGRWRVWVWGRGGCGSRSGSGTGSGEIL
jgi:hypothetical protein